MARNRVIYQSEALFVGPDATSGHYCVPTGVLVKRVAGSATSIIDLRNSRVAANEAGTNNCATSNTAVTLSGIFLACWHRRRAPACAMVVEVWVHCAYL